MQKTEKQLGKEEGLATTLLYHGDNLFNDGRDDEALACYIGCEQLARQGGFHDITLLSLERRVGLHRRTGNLALAERVAREGLHFCVSIDDMWNLLTFQGLLCTILRRRGEMEEALEIAFTGLEVAQLEQNLAQEFEFLNQIITISLDLGDLDGALRLANCGLRQALERKDLKWSALFLSTIGGLQE